MSRPGKFIPGGGAGNKAGGGDAPGAHRTGPIRAPAADPSAPDPAGGKKAPAKGSSLIKPVAKRQRLPIAVMSAAVCCMLVSVAWYEFAIVPMKQ